MTRFLLRLKLKQRSAVYTSLVSSQYVVGKIVVEEKKKKGFFKNFGKKNK